MNKKVLIGLGVLAVAGIGFYMWKKKQGGVSETETKVAGKTETTPKTNDPLAPEKMETKPEVKASAVGVANVASNAGKFVVSPRFTKRFVPSRNVVTKTDTLTANTDLNVGVGTAKVATRVAPIVASNEVVSVGTVGGGIVPVGRIKSWGGRKDANGNHLCFDEGSGQYVPCTA